MKKYIYQVAAIIKANCTEYKYVVDVDADNQKEAIEMAKGMWDKVHHLFHVKARRLEAHEEALYAFWTRYEGEPQTKSKPEEAHVNIDEMTRLRAGDRPAANVTETASENVSETATADEAADATQADADNKAAAMTAQEVTARKMIAEQTTEYLLKTWEDTTENNNLFVPTVRGWLMDELQSRYPEAYDQWLDSETCEDAALREYINAAIQAEHAATEAADSGRPAPQGDDVSEATRKLAFYVGRHNEMMNNAHIAALKRDSAEMDYLRAADRLYKAIRNAEERLRRAGADVKVTDSDYPWYHITGVTVNGRAVYPEAAPEETPAPQEPDATPEPVSDADGATDSAEPETVKLHDDIDTYAACEKNGITWTRVNADTLAIRADDYQKLLDGAKNKRYIRNLRRDSNTGRFCGGAFALAGTISE